MKSSFTPSLDNPDYFKNFRAFCVNLAKQEIRSEEYENFNSLNKQMVLFLNYDFRKKDKLKAEETLLLVQKSFEQLKNEIKSEGKMEGEVKRLIEEYEPKFTELLKKYDISAKASSEDAVENKKSSSSKGF